ncbi:MULTISPECIES: hypothetical protein [Halorussus]|uniref:DUF7124 domain-containing protein n=1 Tax=Halorussus TaxID=1070314 RepID=UPI001F048960|nr:MULTISPECIES: hypothetical protein [Halorussus]
MTDRIDLDERDAGDDEDEDGPNPGDWFWRGTSDPAEEPATASDGRTASETHDDTGDAAVDSGDPTNEIPDSESETPDSTSAPTGDPIPRVPRENDDRPAGIPVESGGSGTGAGAADAGDGDERSASDAGGDSEQSTATGPHGGGADDMTLAFTYQAATRLANFGAAAADADGWADWVGVVGRVPAHVLNKFQRDRNVDLDFFNGSARGPGERLADVDRHSMFYAERMVVVGVEGEDEAIADEADWEFVPLAEAAEKADWGLDEDGPEEVDDAAAESDDAPDGTDDAAE